jgi:hypothetical protein
VAGGVLLAAVLALHLVLLQATQRAPGAAGAAGAPAAARPAAVLLVPTRPTARAAAADAASGTHPAPAAAGSQGMQPALAGRTQARLGGASDPALPLPPGGATSARSAPAPVAAAAPVTHLPADEPATAGGSATAWAPDPEPDPTPPGTPVPTYATRPPPTTTLAYTLQRGARSVPARLLWAHDGSAYTLALATDDTANDTAGPLRGLGATSRGSFDATGLAPERFVDRRHGRDRRAASFQRDTGRLLQSAGPAPAPLQPGMQDRVSWMLQLAAILEANPALAAPGAHVQLWVAATRGPPQVWHFEVLPPAAAGSTDSEDTTNPTPPGLLHLRHRPGRPHALQVDAWLDPARHHLPWRVLLSTPSGDWRSDLRLAER